MQSFSRRRLYQTLAVPEVQAVSPLYLAIGTWKNPVNNSDRSILVLGIDPTKSPFKMPEVNAKLDEIKRLDIGLFDRDARPEFGPIPQLLQQVQGVKTEVGGRKLKFGDCLVWALLLGLTGVLLPVN